MIFLVFWYVLVKKNEFFKVGIITETILNGVYGFLMIFLYSVSSSVIPEKLAEIRNTAKYFITKYGNSPFISRNALFYLKRIEKEDAIYISACGMFKFTRKFVLSAIGITLTYNLLLINIK